MRKLTPDDGSFHITAPAQSDADRLLQPGELDFDGSSGQEGLTAELLDMRVNPVDDLLDKLKVRYQMKNLTWTTNYGQTPTRSQAPRAQALRSHRETFGGRRFNVRGFAQTACKLNDCLFKRNGWEPQVTFPYPVSTTSSKASLIPYADWGIEFETEPGFSRLSYRRHLLRFSRAPQTSPR
ncbi:hypothetical protein J7337_012705 [Fusarium musae]|uniref:Uncharacterized protein n=1 Tax=Fusarium musae TaxID=1042133 RepID=A0A9P8D6F6_9HYPO|nr:hypothetical protein J7337_012705 [Fusarium musae]KAG9496126.1 hypothetical protein J7337_012705 [Fusarium musae]